MEVKEFEPEFYALPRWTSGLPDLLILSQKLVDGTGAALRAYVVKPSGDGIWSQRYYVEDKDGMEWARAYATEKIRQQVLVKQPSESALSPEPFQLQPFVEWKALAVQFEMGFYQGLRQVARRTDDVQLASKLREALAMPEVHMEPEFSTLGASPS